MDDPVLQIKLHKKRGVDIVSSGTTGEDRKSVV